jgi:hypothetical protein
MSLNQAGALDMIGGWRSAGEPHFNVEILQSIQHNEGRIFIISLVFGSIFA